MPSTYYRTPLTTGWRWRLANSNGQTEADENPKLREWNVVDKSVPSVIHSELLANKDIEDYRVGENERSVQWVGLADWEYSCSFHGPDTKAEEINLVFEGLDTIATVKLNGTEILQSENQFLSHRVSIKHLLKAEGQNELSIVFQSAVKKSRELEGKHGKRTSIIRDAGRNYIRKSAYHWGWDWGPVILTAGPWKPVFLETCDNRIADVHITSDLATDHGSALVTINIRVEYQLLSHSFTIKITDQDGQVVAKEHLSSIGQNATVSVRLLDPKLWWPNGQGDQHLYTLRGSLLDTSSGEIFDSKVLRFGIRTIKVIQRPLTDAPGKTFMFNVNGRDIFAQGANWIPADNLLTTVSRSRYFDWMKLARYHHLNMIRVWGGGIYEAEDFFDACDELGLLVWHDFAFACGDYPTNPEFLAIVKKEAETQVLRLRNRTSLALLCGNNEDFMFCDMGK
jgi:beta-mannosidase